MARALHDGLSAREFYVGIEALREREVQAADQQESKLRFTQLLVELRVAAPGDIDLITVLRLRPDVVVDGFASGEGGERRSQVFADVPGSFCSPPPLAKAT